MEDVKKNCEDGSCPECQEKEEEEELIFKKLDEKGRYKLKKLFAQKKKMDKRLAELQAENKKWDKDLHILLGVDMSVKVSYDDLLLAML